MVKDEEVVESVVMLQEEKPGGVMASIKEWFARAAKKIRLELELFGTPEADKKVTTTPEGEVISGVDSLQNTACICEPCKAGSNIGLMKL